MVKSRSHAVSIQNNVLKWYAFCVYGFSVHNPRNITLPNQDVIFAILSNDPRYWSAEEDADQVTRLHLGWAQAHVST